MNRGAFNASVLQSWKRAVQNKLTQAVHHLVRILLNVLKKKCIFWRSTNKGVSIIITWTSGAMPVFLVSAFSEVPESVNEAVIHEGSAPWVFGRLPFHMLASWQWTLHALDVACAWLTHWELRSSQVPAGYRRWLGSLPTHCSWGSHENHFLIHPCVQPAGRGMITGLWMGFW